MNYYFTNGEKPEELVDPNIRTDFNKLAYLIRLDHGLSENFSALEMTNTSNFKSLLFYSGLLLSIKGTDDWGNSNPASTQLCSTRTTFRIITFADSYSTAMFYF